MTVSGEYIVTVKFYNDGLEMGYCEISYSIENSTASGLLQHMRDTITLPEGATHYQIKGIYKL